MELSHAEIRSLIAAALPQGEWIEDVSPSHVISQSADGQMHRRDYQIGADRAVSLAEPVAVRREISYERVFSFSVLPQAYAAVSRKGKLFEAQFFAERGIGVSEEELDEVIAGFSGAPILIQHASTIFYQLPADQRPGFVTRPWRKRRELSQVRNQSITDTAIDAAGSACAWCGRGVMPAAPRPWAVPSGFGPG